MCVALQVSNDVNNKKTYSVTISENDRLITLSKGMLFDSIILKINGIDYKATKLDSVTIKRLEAHPQLQTIAKNDFNLVVRSFIYSGPIVDDTLTITITGDEYKTDYYSACNCEDDIENIKDSICSSIRMFRHDRSNHNIHARPISKSKVLSVDTGGCKKENHIQKEQHEVDYKNNMVIITPCCGDFYDTDLVLKYGNKILTRDIDYKLINVKLYRQHTIQSEHRIFGSISIISDIQGVVSISYHAVGGYNKQITEKNIKNKLEETNNVVSDLLSKTISLQNLTFNKFKLLEKDISLLNEKISNLISK